ncbi:MAG: phosphatidylserine decarboxylase [Candidatus Rokubacteria bacterium]|nr:phosphatidylserine decarboxylase [Candidatus Rokubacteria bacterium]MBI3824999.1 phosphatidylserine decarboxylase [Candidatus Rokubacteria bacterium]
MEPRRPRLPVAREGWPFILVPGAIAAGLLLAGRRGLAAPFAAASLASLGFFRDPERVIPDVANGILAPADGKVTDIADTLEPFVGPSVRVTIFLSPLDVHVNRAPIAGLVAGTTYTPGRIVPAYRPEAADNERCAINIQGDTARVTVTQIAGIAARRIVCRVAAGDKLVAGERFGMIRFGSRTDCFVPRGTDIRVRLGDRVTAGQTVIGILR